MIDIGLNIWRLSRLPGDRFAQGAFDFGPSPSVIELDIGNEVEFGWGIGFCDESGAIFSQESARRRFSAAGARSFDIARRAGFDDLGIPSTRVFDDEFAVQDGGLVGCEEEGVAYGSACVCRNRGFVGDVFGFDEIANGEVWGSDGAFEIDRFGFDRFERIAFDGADFENGGRIGQIDFADGVFTFFAQNARYRMG